MQRIREEGVATVGLSNVPIKMEWFFDLEGNKTKFNWLLHETALEYYSRIQDSEALTDYREQYNSQQIAQFCTYYARRMKKSLLNCLKGRTKSVIHYRDYIDDFYPHHDDRLNSTLEDVAFEAWSHMLSECENCPSQCLVYYQSRSFEFDVYED